MNLYHYSGKILKRLTPKPQYLHKDNFKPSGFWVSVEDDWERWCKQEDFGVQSLKYKHKVKLTDNAKIYLISNPGELATFTARYGNGPYGTIFWERVAIDYDGIIIAPYLWPCRLEYSWYYPWDVASGCIWNYSVIDSIVLVKTLELEEIKNGANG